MRILNCGCGSKYIIATHHIDLNKEHINGKSNGIVWNLNKIPLPYPDSYFDKIYMNHVLEHLDIETDKILLDLRRILKSMGELTIKVPNMLWWYHRVCYLLGLIPNDFVIYHKKHFTRKHLALIMHNVGFKIKPVWNKSMLKMDCMGFEITIKGRKET